MHEYPHLSHQTKGRGINEECRITEQLRRIRKIRGSCGMLEILFQMIVCRSVKRRVPNCSEAALTILGWQ
jgi:hypothetical protein